MDTIKNRIKYLRKTEKLTQKEFAKRLLISQSYLSGIENGNEIPTNKLLKLICLEFGIKESWLIDGTGEMYDEVYENDKVALVEISNSALLQIMNLLSTQSNVEYGFFAISIKCFANLLEQSIPFEESFKLEYLELLQNLVLDIERMISASLNKKKPSLAQHRKDFCNDLEALLKCTNEISS